MELYRFFSLVFIGLVLLLPLASVRAVIATTMTVERFVYDGYQATLEGDEYIKLCNISGSPVDLSNGGTNPWRVGDDELSSGGAEGMYQFPGVAAATVEVGGCIIVAKNGNAFANQWGVQPDFEFAPGMSNGPAVDMVIIDSGSFGLANTGDNITLWQHNGAAYVQHDEAAYGTATGLYTEVGLSDAAGDRINCTTTANCALTRNLVNADTDNMAVDFNDSANPTAVSWHSFKAVTPRTWWLQITAVGLACFTWLLWRKRQIA